MIEALQLAISGQKQFQHDHSVHQPNWFIRRMLHLKANTWDRLPTWGKWVFGGLLVLATLISLSAISFGTAGLIAPAFAASLVVGLHLASAGVSIPLSAFIGALASGTIAAFLFGVVPAATAITAITVAPEITSRKLYTGGKPSCSNFFSGLFATATCGHLGQDSVAKYQSLPKDEDLIDDSQQSSCCFSSSTSNNKCDVGCGDSCTLIQSETNTVVEGNTGSVRNVNVG